MARTTNPGPPHRTPLVATTNRSYGTVLSAKHIYDPYYMSHGGRRSSLPLSAVITSNPESPLVAPGHVFHVPFDLVRNGSSAFWNIANPTHIIIPTAGLYMILVKCDYSQSTTLQGNLSTYDPLGSAFFVESWDLDSLVLVTDNPTRCINGLWRFSTPAYMVLDFYNQSVDTAVFTYAQFSITRLDTLP